MPLLPTRLSRVFNLVLARAIKTGAQFGLAQSPIIPSSLKRLAGKKHQQLSPSAGSLTHAWESKVFDAFWFGRPGEAFDAIVDELRAEKTTTVRLDFIVRLMWHGVVNEVWQVTPDAQKAWEESLRRNQWADHPDHRYQLGQWLAAQKRSNQPCISWNPDSEVESFAELSKKRNLQIDPLNIDDSVAAIRFSLPETWLAGHTRLYVKDLQRELSAFARWINVSGDELVARHVVNCMRKGRLFKYRYFITEGNDLKSDLPLLIHGPNWQSVRIRNDYQSEPKKVLYTLGAGIPWQINGYTTRSHALLRELNSHGWQVPAATKLAHALTYVPREDAPAANVDVLQDGVRYLGYARLNTGRQTWNLYLSKYFNDLKNKVQNEKPAIIHAASTWIIGVASRNVANEFGLPLIYEVRGFPHISTSSMRPGFGFTAMFRLHHSMEMAVAREADHVFAITDGVKDVLISAGVDPNKISLLPNGVNRIRFSPQDRDSELEHALDLRDKIVVGYIGSFVAYEGLDLLISAFHRLVQARPNVVLLLVGDGPIMSELKQQVHALGLNHHVRFVGAVLPDEVERYYSLVDIAPFPRRGIPVCELVSPMKPFEALAMEKSCIVSSVRALADIVADRERGLVFEKDSIDSLFNAIMLLISQPDLGRRLGRTGREWVLGNYTWEQHARHVHATYEELLQQKANKG